MLDKLSACDSAPTPETTSPQVGLMCLQGLADLERLEGPWVKLIASGDSEDAAVILHLLLPKKNGMTAGHPVPFLFSWLYGSSAPLSFGHNSFVDHQESGVVKSTFVGVLM